MALVSNNDEATVRLSWTARDSLLEAEHFSALSATGAPKSARLAEAAHARPRPGQFPVSTTTRSRSRGCWSALPEVLSVTCLLLAERGILLGRLWPLVPAAATAEDALHG